ncbi:MAG: sulfate ABC transporter permease subunit CysT [Alphaproteobacteria bacterium]|nr:sulfate ABC transporter permease subunit CysT [Alphaproteobacteria bacterium]
MPISATVPWRKRQSVIPGFGMTLGFTLAYLSLIALIPLAVLLFRAAGMGWHDFAALAGDKRTLSAVRLSFSTALLAALVNVVIGLPTAWVLARYDFPGRRVVDAIIDLPFALPTAVAGIALTSLYAPNGWLGAGFAALGVKIAYTPLGITLALIFIGLPFMVRTVQPVIADLEPDMEEAAATLGANRGQTFSLVLLPPLLPAILTGFALAFARGMGEYGSVIFIAGNLPYVSEIAPLLIVIRLEEFNYEAATAIAAIILGVSFASLLAINVLQAWSRRSLGHDS